MKKINQVLKKRRKDYDFKTMTSSLLSFAVTLVFAFTTYKLTMASIQIRKQKHGSHNNILVTELRTINFIDALVSVLTLQNTLIMVNQTKSSIDNMFVLSAVSSAIVIVFMTIRLLVKGR